MDPEAVDVEAPQEWRKPHKHDYAKSNEVTHGIVDKNIDLEALALEYRFFDRGSTVPVLRQTMVRGSDGRSLVRVVTSDRQREGSYRR